ncbi:MAG: RluA family pseudouridine synthase [Anaerolineales bacterium]|nr:RluA family pseudouridine synthase [Anaerolineales bacterium]
MNEGPFTFRYRGEGEERLDIILSDEFEEYSRTRLQSLIEEGYVSVGEKTVKKKSQTIPPEMEITVVIPPPRPSELIPEDIPLEIIFEDEHVVIVNKPAGMVVHPSAGHPSGTLVNAVLAHVPEIEGVGGVKRPGLVHRLDQDTSGIVVLAKDDQAHQFLQDQFRKREVEKVYLALVDGHPPSSKGRVEVAIGRDPGHRQRMAPVLARKGKEAVSEYFTKETFPEHTYLEVHPLTGRTHQIRVHLAFLECPVVADTTYGRNRPTLPLDRQFLHAAQLTITLPGEQGRQTLTAPLPEELFRVLEDLRMEKKR